MYNIEIHKVLKNGTENKIYTIDERGDHVDFKYIIQNEF